MISLYTFIFLDATSRLKRAGPLHGAPPTSLRSLAKLVNIQPISESDIIAPAEWFAHLLVWTILLAPIPFMRVLARYHTPSQAAAGSAIGVLQGVVCWFVVRALQRRFKHLEG